MGLYAPDPPAAVTRDPGKETADTLRAQLEMERGTGQFADIGPRIDIERQYRPQYTQLDNDTARAALYGDRGNNGMLALMAESGPELARINQSALSAQRAGDIADVSSLAGASRSAYEQLNPEGAALLKRINSLRMEELADPYAMSASQRRGAEQNVRGAQSVRGMGMGPTDAFQEAMYLGDRQRGLYNERLQGAAQTVGIYSVLLGANGESQAHTPPIEFTLSPYSFPFSDNTLLPGGNRFGIYLTRIDDIPGVARIMRLSFVWFPRNFVPPRERPFDLDVGTSPPLAGNQ